jgi:hypothetical protein
VSRSLDVEAQGWTSSDMGKILSVYVSDGFMGIEAYEKDKPNTWKVTFKNLDEWKAFCTQRLERTQYRVSGKTLYVDRKGDQALAVTQRTGEVTHREAGTSLSFDDYDLWMLRKVGERWKIATFIRRFPLPGKVSEG